MDDRRDEHGTKRARALALTPSFRHFHRRASKRYPALAEGIAARMAAFDQAERETLTFPSVDRPAEAFGQVLSLLFTHGLDGEAARIAHHIGLHVGRWLYVIDAIDDYEEDVRRGRPNPLHRLYGDEGLTAERREHLQLSLVTELKAARRALDLVTVDEQTCGKELLPLLYHILDIALPDTAERILFPKTPCKATKKASIDQ
jgi:hypothetical protein